MTETLNHPGAVCHMHGLPCHVLGEVLLERDALRAEVEAKDRAWSASFDAAVERAQRAEVEREQLRVEAEELRAQARASITTEEVERALDNYRCARTISEDGDYLPLADMLTPPGQDTIALGLEERALLADFLASVLATREFAAAPHM